MRAKVASALLALTIISTTTAGASAAWVVDHWTNGYDGHPVYRCSDGSATY
jgi:hypothetical protein